MTSPVSLAPLPDLAGALRAYLRSLPGVQALVGERVWIGWPRDPQGEIRVRVPPYLYAILIESGRGGLPPDPEAPYQTERVDLSCLGPDPGAAHLLWRTVAPYLYDQSRRIPGSFRAANTLVSRVVHEGGPIRVLEPDTQWPRTVCGYQLTYCSLPASELVS
jgi:hypothetical protein